MAFSLCLTCVDAGVHDALSSFLTAKQWRQHQKHMGKQLLSLPQLCLLPTQLQQPLPPTAPGLLYYYSLPFCSPAYPSQSSPLLIIWHMLLWPKKKISTSISPLPPTSITCNHKFRLPQHPQATHATITHPQNLGFLLISLKWGSSYALQRSKRSFEIQQVLTKIRLHFKPNRRKKVLKGPTEPFSTLAK